MSTQPVAQTDPKGLRNALLTVPAGLDCSTMDRRRFTCEIPDYDRVPADLPL